MAFLLCLEIAKGDFHSARESLKLIQEWEDPFERAAIMGCVRRLLKDMLLKSDGTREFREQLLAGMQGATTRARKTGGYSSQQTNEGENEFQYRAAYLVTAARLELRKKGLSLELMRPEIVTEMEDEGFDLLLRSVVYTALFAEATYRESEMSRTYVETINSMKPEKYEPARLLETLSPRGGTRSDDLCAPICAPVDPMGMT